MRQGNEEAGIATAAELWENRDKRMGPSNSVKKRGARTTGVGLKPHFFASAVPKSGRAAGPLMAIPGNGITSGLPDTRASIGLD